MGSDLFLRKTSVQKVVACTAEPRAVPGLDALLFLAEQDLEPTPDNYMIAFRRIFEPRSLMAMAVDSILMDGRKVTQADADRILSSRRKPETDEDRGEAALQQESLRHQTLKLAELTADAASDSHAFSRDLTKGLDGLSEGSASMEKIVATMIDRTQEVEAQLATASAKIEQLRSEVEAVRGDAMRDAMTGLLNRRGLEEELNARTRRAVGTLAICDVDHFKAVNDRHGHCAGDRVLKGVASCLTESLGVHQVGRWGGEEFVIVMDGVDPVAARPLLERAREDLASRSFRLHDTDEAIGRITISLGATSLKNVTPALAVDAADRLLYKAKAEGRNRLAM